MSISAKQSAVIDILKGILPFLVVILHTSYVDGLCWKDGAESFIRLFFVKLGGIAVPTFFVISGLLFFSKLQKWDWTVWSNKVIKRIRTLFVPFILWIIIDFIAKYVWGVMHAECPAINISTFKQFFFDSGGMRMFIDRPQITYEPSVLGYMVDTSKPINGPMWYVRDLMVMVILSPLILKLLNVACNYALIAFFLIYVLFIGLPFILVSPTALFFFSMGAFFSINGKDFLNIISRFKVLSYVLSIAMLVMAFLVESQLLGGLVYRLYIISTVVAIFNLFSDLYEKGVRPVKLLTDSSFFIYASHAVLITEISNFILWRTLPITTEWMLVLKVFLRPAVTVGLCLLLFVAMKKICPKTLGLLTGGRG